LPVLSRAWRALRRHLLDRSRHVHLALPDLGLGSPSRTAEELLEGGPDHHQVVEVGKIVHVEPEGAVLLQVQELLEDPVPVDGLPVGGEAHQLVLPVVDLEAGVIGEGGVEQAQGVWKGELFQELETAPLPDADRRGRPLADPVHREDGRLRERRGVEGARRVGLVVLGEVDPLRLGKTAARERLPDPGLDPELLAHPQGQGPQEGPQPRGGDREVGLEDPMELQDRLVVEGHRIRRAAPRLGQAVADGIDREVLVVLHAGEALLLRGGDELPLVDDAGGRVVVVTADPEDPHGQYFRSRCGDPVRGPWWGAQ
jgi:hypothetical protein